MLMKISTLFVLTAAAGLTAAAPTNTTTPASCAAAIDSILTSTQPGINCIAPAALSQLVRTAAGASDADAIRNQMDIWLDKMCGVGFCSNSTLEYIAGTISAGCTSGLGSLPIPAPLALVSTLKTDYPVVRQMMCLKNTQAQNEYCMSELLGAQAKLGNFASASADTAVSALIGQAFNLDCNECTKAAFSLGKTLDPTLGVAALNNVCGANFTATLSTAAPVGILHTEVKTQFNGAAALSVHTVGYLLAASVLFVML
ncbi:hypothetical protein C8R46DRAFT_1262841 [Mycena filopes]|nr:hypothetical protein C8R46DRAFT_1262841 [Mycena filopes]